MVQNIDRRTPMPGAAIPCVTRCCFFIRACAMAALFVTFGTCANAKEEPKTFAQIESRIEARLKECRDTGQPLYTITNARVFDVQGAGLYVYVFPGPDMYGPLLALPADEELKSLSGKKHCHIRY